MPLNRVELNCSTAGRPGMTPDLFVRNRSMFCLYLMSFRSNSSVFFEYSSMLINEFVKGFESIHSHLGCAFAMFCATELSALFLFFLDFATKPKSQQECHGCNSCHDESDDVAGAAVSKYCSLDQVVAVGCGDT